MGQEKPEEPSRVETTRKDLGRRTKDAAERYAVDKFGDAVLKIQKKT